MESSKVIASYCSIITIYENKKPNNNNFINQVFVSIDSTKTHSDKEIIAMILSIHGFVIIKETNKLCSINQWKSNVLNNLNNKDFVDFVNKKLIKIFEKMVDILNE